ncbi:MAG: hypothetical protein K6A44_04095 [bacterium]|nr:hypothetical protein [bacterium]
MSKVDIQERGNMAVSYNGLIYEGMKKPDISDISKMSVFNFADTDKDGVISKSEVERYNAPIFMKNYDTNREIMFGRCQTRPFQADGYTQFYSGLDIKHVDEKAINDFKLIDIDNNGIISKTEMEKMEVAFNETQKISDKVKSIAQKTTLINWLTGIACTPIPLGMIIWFCNDIEGIVNAPFARYMGTSAAIALGLGVLSIGVAFLCKKLADSQTKKLGEATENHPYALSKTESIKGTYEISKAY